MIIGARFLRGGLCLTALAVLCGGAAAQTGQANRAGPEAQLQAVRDALVEKAMAANTRVSATSWVNERGELMEASQFRSDMQVRGVRVIEYLAGDPPRAEVQVDAASDARNQAPVCREPAAGEVWRHPIELRMVVDRPADPQAMGVASQAGRWIEAALHTQARVDGAVLARTALGQPSSQYEQALWGQPQPRMPLQLLVRVRMLPGWEPHQPGARLERWQGQFRDWLAWHEAQSQAVTLQLDWTVQRAGEAPLLQARSALPLKVSAARRPSRDLHEDAAAVVQREVAQRWLAIQGTLDCEPLVFEARQQGQGQVLLMAGQDAGLRAGDRLVLVDGRLVPRRMLEAEAAPHLALLEIQRVHANRSTAVQVAGPKLDPSSSEHWLALPFGTSLLAARQEAPR